MFCERSQYTELSLKLLAGNHRLRLSIALPEGIGGASIKAPSRFDPCMPKSEGVTAPLYNVQILRLAASIPHHARLAVPMASVEKRSPICGSRITLDMVADADGRVAELGLEVRACALGQASAALLAEHAKGKSAAELAAVRVALADWLAGTAPQPDWPGIDVLAPAIPHSARHASIRLPFEAAAEAAAGIERERQEAAA